MSRKIIVANWKMNADHDFCDQYFVGFFDIYDKSKENMISDNEIIICPPLPFIDLANSALTDYAFSKIEIEMGKQEKSIEDFSENELMEMMLENKPFSIGAQDCHFADSGAYTGDISAGMIFDAGAEFVIIGHSERRIGHNESDEIISKKVELAVKNELVPILCVGESIEYRKRSQHLEYVYSQLIRSLNSNININRLIIAYEPVWSIGTGIIPKQEEISEMMFLIKKIIGEKFPNIKNFQILYGGSVDSENYKKIIEIENVDGVLVGKVSLDLKNFSSICFS